MPHPTLRSRYRGALLGLAAGDALGTTVEFRAPGTFKPVTDMVGGGVFGLQPGQWTDDTSLALCLAESLVESRGFDPLDQLRRYYRWMTEGYLSSTGRCFDIGNTTREALFEFAATGDPYPGPTGRYAGGNGSLMRLAPVPLCFAGDARTAIARAADSSRTTHGARTAVDSCRYFAGLIAGALRGAAKDELLAPLYAPTPGGSAYWEQEPLDPEVREVALGSFRDREPPQIAGKGYVVRTLEAALWAFARTDDFESGALLVVNLGDDADTTGAVYGQLAGAYYGEEAIPARWRERLAMREYIAQLADGLHDLAQG